MAGQISEIVPPVKKRILLLYPYYWPNYKAGGPVQSLFNLVGFFKLSADFYLVALDIDIDGSHPARGLKVNEWSNGPHGERIYTVSTMSPRVLFNVIRVLRPDVILLNGMFNARTTLFGLLFGRWFGAKIVISPRGMLQDWALRRRKMVKKIFLLVFKRLVKHDDKWHATDRQEMNDIHRIFGPDRQVFIASNVPRELSDNKAIGFPAESGEIRLIYLSLINPNKNLHLIMDAVNRADDRVTLDIFGPIIDKTYWEFCRMNYGGPRVSYKGPVPPWEIPALFSLYHFFVLPTEGESFGHAIFDALACGLPVIIPRTTPWQDLDSLQAGLYFDLKEEGDLSGILSKISQWNSSDYDMYRIGSLSYAKKYWEGKDYFKEYGFLLK